MTTTGSGAGARGSSVGRPVDTAPAPSGHSNIASAIAEAKFRLLWALSVRLAPFIDMASRLSASAERGRRHQGDRRSAIPRRWYISHIFFWLGSGTACWYQFRRIDRAAARRHLIRSIWIPPLVWLAALTSIGMAIPDEVVVDMVRNAPYRVHAP